VDATFAAQFVESAVLAAGLATDPAVAEHWADESACAQMTVGGLARHLTDQVRTTVEFVGEDPPDQSAITLAEFYRLAGWVWAPPDAENHVGLRTEADADAASGPQALADELPGDLDRLRAVLADVESRTPDTVFVPWEGVTLSTRDWLVSRAVELVVHADDLAASVGLQTPEFPASVVEAVLGAMSSLAVERHGQVAVVRTLARPQRAPGSVQPF
jgi:hypothetical protein